MSSSFKAYVNRREVWVFRSGAGYNDSHNHGGAVGAAETRVTFKNVYDFGRGRLFRGSHTVSSLWVVPLWMG